MRISLVAAVLVIVASAGWLLLPGSNGDVTAADWKAATGCTGFVYHVASTDAWFKALPPYKQATQQGYDAELVRKSHYVYEGGPDWERRMNFQRAMAAAVKDGWIMMDVDATGMTATMVHPKLTLNTKCLIPTKAPWKE